MPVYCIYDDFSTYGSGNTVIGKPTGETTQYQQAFPATNTAVAIQNASSQLEISSSVTDDSAPHGILRRWGVSGQGDNPDFTTGYANATSLEFDLVSFDWAGSPSNPELNSYCGFSPTGVVDFRPAIEFDSLLSGSNRTRYRTNFVYTGGTVFLAQTGFNATGDTSAIEGTYKIEMYDGAIVSGAYKFEWKIWLNGSVVAQSLNGTTRVNPALTFDCGDTTDAWCQNPRIQFYNYIVQGTKKHPTMTIDNVKLHVNADDSCDTGVPPV